MKTATLYYKLMAFLATALALSLALAICLSSCDKDDDKKDDNNSDLYSPSQNMTNDEILTLFEEVSDQMATVRQFTAEMRGTNEEFKDLLVLTMQIDFDAKKEVQVDYGLDGKMSGFTYTENDRTYRYSSYESTQKYSYKVSDAYWNKSADISDMEEMFSLKWNVENQTFVGTLPNPGGASMKMTLTLTTDKKIAGMRIEATYGGISEVEDVKFTYSANPALPSGFSLSDFPLAQQYSVKVVWGEGLGENTFYTEPNRSSSYYIFYSDDVIDYAPKVPGKRPVLYSNSSFTGNPVMSTITVTNNSMVLYAKWEAGSGANRNAKSASRPAAASLLKRAPAKLQPERAQ
ncbi:MAG: hypothetical protein LBL94_10815 [Prevotellaceae bacterium]|jgi:hypothetical protein|nr:hypothetical protein [Prevotellaceae bacterium]